MNEIVPMYQLDMILFSLGLGQNQSFGPKQNTKFGVGSTTTTHHPPPTTQNFWEGSKSFQAEHFKP